VTYDIRRIRGADDIWVAEMTVSYHGGDLRYGVDVLEIRNGRLVRRWSTSANRSTRRSGGLRGGRALTDPTADAIGTRTAVSGPLARRSIEWTRPRGPLKTRNGKQNDQRASDNRAQCRAGAASAIASENDGGAPLVGSDPSTA